MYLYKYNQKKCECQENIERREKIKVRVKYEIAAPAFDRLAMTGSLSIFV